MSIEGYDFAVVPTRGHTVDHVCLFETTRRWLFAGDLYVSERLDAQLDGVAWIESLGRVITLRPTALFDGHGLVVRGADAVHDVLAAKRSFLEAVRDRTLVEAPAARSLPELTKRVFAKDGLVDCLSEHEGRLSLLTGSDFARSNLVRSFLPGAPAC